jgi:hypothetical protein
MKNQIVILFLLFLSMYGRAQHDHHHHTQPKKDSTVNHKQHEQPAPVQDTVSSHLHHESESPMSHAFSLSLPMTRNGSGTGWLPDSTPMYGYMIHSKKWMFMLHGNIFARYNRQDLFNGGTRGGEKFDVVNWYMGMGQRKIGARGLFRFSVMFSLDNIFGGDGYPLLFQTGESWKGRPLVDRQHPHDLFSELSVAYTHRLSKHNDVFIYVGYPGEPALGSVAFMHRVSSLYGPDAPLSHHWNDGTHITFGVVTAGLRLGKFKIEGSGFKGREPDENRLNFDEPKFDSYSGRVSFSPNGNWALQLSQGYVFSPEATRPDENVHRTTASAVYSKPLGSADFFNVTALYGVNRSHGFENAALLEGVLVKNRFAVFARYEYVEKSVHELDLEPSDYGHDATFPVNALTLGGSYDLIKSAALTTAIGAQVSYFSADSRLDQLYGRHPLSGEVFLRIYPPRMR